MHIQNTIQNRLNQLDKLAHKRQEQFKLDLSHIAKERDAALAALKACDAVVNCPVQLGKAGRVALPALAWLAFSGIASLVLIVLCIA